MDIRRIEPGSALHRGELDLRYRVLRAPLEMARGTEVYAHEDDCLHFVALTPEETVLGCVVFHPGGDGGGPGTGRLLQMAVAPQAQGRGLGRHLVEALEAHLVRLGYHQVTLHAREVATGFYRRLGYEFFGEPYLEVGVTHRNMRKNLLTKDG